jgi:hypothetical protein
MIVELIYHHITDSDPTNSHAERSSDSPFSFGYCLSAGDAFGGDPAVGAGGVIGSAMGFNRRKPSNPWPFWPHAGSPGARIDPDKFAGWRIRARANHHHADLGVALSGTRRPGPKTFSRGPMPRRDLVPGRG